MLLNLVLMKKDERVISLGVPISRQYQAIGLPLAGLTEANNATVEEYSSEEPIIDGIGILWV